MRRTTKRRNRKANQRLSQLESLENRTLLTVNAITLDAGPAVVDNAGAGQDRVLRIVNGTQTQDYDSVGIVNGQCSGTLIASNAVLTAAHCVEDGTSSQDFQVEGKTYATDEVFVHEQYNSNDIDLAVMVLSENVTGIDPVDINRTVPEVGQMLTLVGFGATGTANGGHNGDFGVKHVGQTPIDVVTPTEVNWNFDNANESNTAPGDSGGPAFLNQNGNIVVAGVTSGGTQDNAGLGDYSFDMRVDAFANWIDGIVQTNGGTAPDPAPAPPTDPGNGQGDQDPGDQDPGDQNPDTPVEDEAPEDDFSDDFDDVVLDDGDELIQFALDELDLYDQNGDGMMSRRELVREFMDLGDSRREARDFADYLLGEFDDDGDGKLDLSELAATYGDGDVEVDDDSQDADDPFAEDQDFGWGDDDWGVDDWGVDDWGVDDWSSQQEDAHDVFANFGWFWW